MNTMARYMEEDILETDFRILSFLGYGTFGEVILACHLPTHTEVAVKVLEKSISSVAQITSEVEILQSLEHRNIVRFFHMIDTLTTTYLIMEYMDGEDLRSYLLVHGYLKEEEARPIFQQVVSAVHFLHQRHIAHCNIKLENILVDTKGNTKLCDFGLAIKIRDGEMLQGFCGSVLYCAPEILAREPYDGLAGDMWSLGVLLYAMVTGKFPYEETTLAGMHELITTTKCPIPSHLSKPCHIISVWLLMVTTGKRITIHQLVERPWLSPIHDYVPPDAKAILPRVVDAMCTIGYTCEEIVSSLTHRRLSDKVTATINILKYHLSCGDSHQQDEKLWLKKSPAGALSLPLHLTRRASEPALSTGIQPGESPFHVEGTEGRGKKYRSYTMVHEYSYLKRMTGLGNPVPEAGCLRAGITTTTPVDLSVNGNSMGSLPAVISAPAASLDGRALNMDRAAYRNSMDSLPGDTSSPAASLEGTALKLDLSVDRNYMDSLDSLPGDTSSPAASLDGTALNMDLSVDRNTMSSLPAAISAHAASLDGPALNMDRAVNRNSMGSLPGAISSPEASLDGRALNMDRAANRNSMDSLPGAISSPAASLDGTALNMDLSANGNCMGSLPAAISAPAASLDGTALNMDHAANRNSMGSMPGAISSPEASLDGRALNINRLLHPSSSY